MSSTSSKKILIDAVYQEEIRVVTSRHNIVEEYDYDTIAKRQIKGNLYLARITRVEPSLQAGFVEYSDGKHGFLPFAEIHPEYYIPLNEDGTMQDVPDDYNLKLILENKVFTSPSLKPEDEKPPESVPEIRAHNQVVDQPAPEIFDVIDAGAATEGDVDAEDKKIDADSSLIEIDEENLVLPIEDSDVTIKKFKIQDVIRKNQIILVQVIKEERGNKGASLTTYLSLAGRYCVLMPNSVRQGGISRRISNIEDRKRIKDVIESLGLPSGAGVIIRTAGADRSNAEIKRDYDYLVKLWNSIRENVFTAKVPTFLHAEGDVIKRCIRDNYDSEIEEILVQGEAGYKSARDFMKVFMADHVDKVKHYKSKVPLFTRFGIEEQINNMHEPIVYLNSGGYIVINHTEALIAIDVNSGKATSESNVEETAVKTNMEAAVEIARQIRMRDLSGLIVVDFIDMIEPKNKSAVENTLRNALQYDKAKIHLSRISPLGLLEISRQRLKPSFLESNTVVCNHCNGKGRVRAVETMAVNIIRAIEAELSRGDYDELNVYAAADHIVYLLNNYRDEISRINQRSRTRVNFHIDYMMQSDQYAIDKVRRSPYSYYDTPALTNFDYKDYSSEAGGDDNEYKDNKKSNKWRRNKDHRQQNQQHQQAQKAQTEKNNKPAEESVSNVDILEQENNKLTKTGGYRKINKRSRNNRRFRKRGHHGDRNKELKEGEKSYPSDKELVGVMEKRDDNSPSLLRELWKKIMD